MFACEHEGVMPDFLCLAKGLTGGYLPLAATLTTERVYEGFLGELEELQTFFHGHTYTGNPLACAAALATLDVFEQERTLERLQRRRSTLLGRWLADARRAARRASAEVRRRGFMAGIELPASRRRRAWAPGDARGPPRGAIVRPLGDVVVLMPPLSIAEPSCAAWWRSPRPRSPRRRRALPGRRRQRAVDRPRHALDERRRRG